MRDPVLLTLFGALVLLVLVAVLQVIFRASARRQVEAAVAALTTRELYLHLGTTGQAPAVFDQIGRRLMGVKAMRYDGKLDQVDRIYLEVLAHDGQGYLMHGRRIAPTRTTGQP